MKLLKSRKLKRIWKKSAKRLSFGGLKKIAVVVLLVGLNWAGITAIGTTMGYLNDSENSSENVFAASSLDIVLSPDGIYASGLIYPGDSVVEAINLASGGTLPYQYTASAEILGGEEACGHFTMTATTDGAYSYSGAIGGFASPASVSSGPDDWNFTFDLSSSTPPEVWGRSCFFKWVFTAWQTDFGSPGGGFYDTDERLGQLRIGKAVVLNEFITNPTGLDNAPKPGGEWMELYNNSSISFDLNGWYIYDSTDDGEIPIDAGHTIGGTVIPAHGFLVVYRDGDDDFELDNSGGDSVRLFTARISEGGVLVDSYSYSSGKPEGFSFARIPDGVGSWVDPVPTPGRPNKLAETEEESETIVEELTEELTASASFSETLETAVSALSEFIAGGFSQIASESQELTGGEEAVAASESQEITPTPEPSMSLEPSPEASPEPSETPEPAETPEPTENQQLPEGDGNTIQTVEEPAIPVEPVTVEPPTEVVQPPPADPPLPTSPSENLGGQAVPAPEPAPAPVEAPAPAPEAPAE